MNVLRNGLRLLLLLVFSGGAALFRWLWDVPAER